MTLKFVCSVAAAVSLAVFTPGQAGAQPAPRYSVIDLGGLVRNGSSMGFVLNENRIVGGSASGADGTQQAALWGGPFLINLGTPGLNSGVDGVNASGQAALSTEVAQKDPNNENFCGWGTGLRCVGAVWQRGVLTALPTLGGNNVNIGLMNNKGEISGVAETGAKDTTCPGTIGPGGTGPQLFGFQAVVWGPRTTDVRTLKPLAGDTVGMALGINDNSQTVGASGTCTTSALPPIAYGSHAVMWDADGTAHDLGNLGSTAINMALAINNSGTVIGVSAVTDKATPGNGVHAYTWTLKGGMKDLGVLPGDAGTVGLGINEAGGRSGHFAGRRG